MNYIENEKVINSYWEIHWAYDNFVYDDNCDTKPYTTLKECFKAYLHEVDVNKDMMKAIDEPKCYYRLVHIEETESTQWYSEYKVVHHRNGRYSLKRVY